MIRRDIKLSGDIGVQQLLAYQVSVHTNPKVTLEATALPESRDVTADTTCVTRGLLGSKLLSKIEPIISSDPA